MKERVSEELQYGVTMRWESTMISSGICGHEVREYDEFQRDVAMGPANDQISYKQD